WMPRSVVSTSAIVAIVCAPAIIQKRLSRRCNACRGKRLCAKCGGAAFAPAQINSNAAIHTHRCVIVPQQFLENCPPSKAGLPRRSLGEGGPQRPQPFAVNPEQFTSRGIRRCREL